MQPSIEDVASRAGVSRQTVSRVINGRNWVSGETRERVLEAIRELGYRRNALASGLRSGQTHTVGLLLSDILNSQFASEARGVQDVADAAGYQVILGNTDENAVKEERLLRMLREKRVDGAIVIPCQPSSRRALAEFVAESIPVVLLNRFLPGFDSVWFDAHDATCDAIQHLVEQGYRRIALMTVPRRSSTARDRVRGYRETLERNGIAYDPGLALAPGFDAQSGHDAMLALLQSAKPPTAVFVSSSQLTLGALLAIKDAGLRIPEDVALIGSNESRWSRVADPPLTMVQTNGYELGCAAAELLLRRIRGDREGMPQSIRVPRILEVRQSSGPAGRVATPTLG